VAYNFAYDHYVPELNSGFGFIATHDRAGAGAMRGNSIAVQYAYELKITRETAFRPAIQLGYGNRNINFNDLVFGDQLIRNAATTLEENIFEPVSFFDAAAGGLLFNPRYWIGVSAHHLNQPNESLYPDRFGLIPMKFSIHGGYRFKLSGGMYKRNSQDLVLAFNYKQQADFNQFDIGAYYELDPLVIGLWYRGLPVVKSNGYGYLNQDAVAALIGISTEYFRFGYSYDITVSRLNLGATAGAHEISLMYEWASVKNAKAARKRIIPCAKF
jgi:type IX secretion system PorP/SprF family membrane protein